jgi:hypothetical protein
MHLPIGKMKVWQQIVVAAFGLALVPVASFAATYGHTAQAAQMLERQADAFASDARGEASPADYARRAQDFAAQAHDFSQSVGKASDRDVVLAFQSLWRSYHDLSGDVRSADDRAHFKPVSAAFAEVQLDVKNRYADADGSLLTSGGYVFDPYYNN